MALVGFGLVLLLLTSCSEVAPPLNETFKDYREIQNISINSSMNQTDIPIKEVYVPKHNKTLSIASFNIESFSYEKSQNNYVSEELLKILNKYDIVVLQGLTDKRTHDEFIISNLRGHGFVTSESIDNEFISIIYKKSAVDITMHQTFNDDSNKFKRKPLLASVTSYSFDFVIIGFYANPLDAQEEIKKLETVINYTKQKYRNDNIFVIGSMYADCLYYTPGTALKNYYWVIKDNEDTTISRRECAYDRIITTEDYTYMTRNSGVYKYTDNLDLAKALSNHYPIFIEVNI